VWIARFFHHRLVHVALLASSFALAIVGSPRMQAVFSEAPPASSAKSPDDSPQTDDLPARCAAAAKELRSRLGEMELANWHRRTIQPAAEAIANCYTKTAPDKPITILLFADEKSYRAAAERLFGDRKVSVYGYYKPSLRTMVMNIGTGGGTLVHELTHALVDFDFPAIPDWFNEGLASLHEQCRFKADEHGIKGPFIDGLANWRLPALQKAIAEGRLRPLEALIGEDDFRGRLEGLNYAQARYFCMYLQERGLLRTFYHTFRDGRKDDRLGLRTAKALFPDQSWDEVNAAFRRWAAGLKQ
jgi:hypothetical protein